jgi:hypothetical protein
MAGSLHQEGVFRKGHVLILHCEGLFLLHMLSDSSLDHLLRLPQHLYALNPPDIGRVLYEGTYLPFLALTYNI